jgi:hypothetical protein
MELTSHSCRFPLGEPAGAETRFCGAQRLGDRPYCPYHCRIAYAPDAEATVVPTGSVASGETVRAAVGVRPHPFQRDPALDRAARASAWDQARYAKPFGRPETFSVSTDRERSKTGGAAPGRYNLRGARHPANGLGAPPRSANAFTAIVAVPDPHPDPRGPKNERIIAAVNRSVDILEVERSHDRISDAAYAVGRIVQAVFERARGLGPSPGWRARDRVDAAWAHEAAIIRALEDARKVKEYMARIRDTLGMIDTRIVEEMIGNRMSYADVAARRGRAGERGERYFAARFRDALEALAEAWAARGCG